MSDRALMAKKYSILYVDDEADNLLAFRSVFRRFYDVTTAEGGEEALKLLRDRSFDLILSDQRMPEMTGVEFFEAMMENFPTPVRIIVTGYSEMKPINKAMKEGKVAKCITKPWNVEELRKLIQKELES